MHEIFDPIEHDVYTKYIAALSHGIAAADISSRTLHLGEGSSSEVVKMAEYIDVLANLDDAKQRYRAMVPEVAFLVNEAIYGKVDVTLQERYARMSRTMRTLQDKIHQLEHYATKVRLRDAQERNRLQEEKRGVKKNLRRDKPQDYLSNLKAINGLNDTLRSLDESGEIIAMKALPRFQGEGGEKQGKAVKKPRAVKKKVDGGEAVYDASGGSSLHVVDINKIKKLVKTRFGKNL